MSLTRRETECLERIKKGYANKEIASELNISERTVKFHVSALLEKAGVPGRMLLVNWIPMMDTLGVQTFISRFNNLIEQDQRIACLLAGGLTTYQVQQETQVPNLMDRILKIYFALGIHSETVGRLNQRDELIRGVYGSGLMSVSMAISVEDVRKRIPAMPPKKVSHQKLPVLMRKKG